MTWQTDGDGMYLPLPPDTVFDHLATSDKAGMSVAYQHRQPTQMGTRIYARLDDVDVVVETCPAVEHFALAWRRPRQEQKTPTKGRAT